MQGGLQNTDTRKSSQRTDGQYKSRLELYDGGCAMIDVGCKELFTCDECPIAEELELRMGIAIDHPEYGNFQFDHCGCDKVGDEFFQCGYCEDAWASFHTKPKSGKRKNGRAYRRRMKAKKLNRLMDIASHRNDGSLWPGLDRTGLPATNWRGFLRFDIDDDDIPKAYIKRPKSSKYKGFYKNYSNRVIRRKGVVLPKGNHHHKRVEYWWMLY